MVVTAKADGSGAMELTYTIETYLKTGCSSTLLGTETMTAKMSATPDGVADVLVKLTENGAASTVRIDKLNLSMPAYAFNVTGPGVQYVKKDVKQQWCIEYDGGSTCLLDEAMRPAQTIKAHSSCATTALTSRRTASYEPDMLYVKKISARLAAEPMALQLHGPSPSEVGVESKRTLQKQKAILLKKELAMSTHAFSLPSDAALATLLQPQDSAFTPIDGLRRLRDAGLDQLPLPGHGATLRRWQMLAAIAAIDLSLLKLYESHTDELAIRRKSTARCAGRAAGACGARNAGARPLQQNGGGRQCSCRKAWFRCDDSACMISCERRGPGLPCLRGSVAAGRARHR